MSIRPVKSISQATPTIEGAGVKLHRAFGFHTKTCHLFMINTDTLA